MKTTSGTQGGTPEYNFDRVPEDFILQIRTALRQNLRGRLVEMTPKSASTDFEWKAPAKLSRAGWRGSNGVLTVGPGEIAFEAARPEALPHVVDCRHREHRHLRPVRSRHHDLGTQRFRPSFRP